MSSLNILELIKKRTRYPMGNRIGDAWVDEILQRDDEMTYLITTENLSTLMGIQGRNKRRILFETYHISGIFGLSNPMAGTAVNLMLLILQKDKTNYVLSGTYNNGLYYGRSYRLGLREDSIPIDIYPADFRDYCAKIEQWVIEGIIPADGDCYKFNTFSSEDINLDKVFPQHYSKAVYDIYHFLKQERTVPLSTIASVIRPRPVHGERAKVIGVRDFKYPISCEEIGEGWKTDTLICKGDIICKNSMTDKLYLLLDELSEEIYAGANDIVIRPNNIEEAAYIYSYIKSETGRTVISANTTGTVLPRMAKRDWENIPVILPKKSLIEYEKYFRLQHYQQKSVSEYNDFFGFFSQDPDVHSVEDILNMEMVKNVRLYKGEIIREFLEEDLKELNACFRAKAYKATLILCGSILEAVLIDWVSEKHRKNYFNEDLYVQDRNGRSKRADLIDYINIIKEIQKPAWMEEADKAHFIRQKRNLVHAKLCLKSEEINEMVCREVIDYLNDVLKTRGFILS